jgi:hypothetical protein
MNRLFSFNKNNANFIIQHAKQHTFKEFKKKKLRFANKIMNGKSVGDKRTPFNNTHCLCGEKKAHWPNKDCPLRNNRED